MRKGWKRKRFWHTSNLSCLHGANEQNHKISINKSDCGPEIIIRVPTNTKQMSLSDIRIQRPVGLESFPVFAIGKVKTSAFL